MKVNQKQRILDYIKQFGSITSKDAYVDLGITQLGARIDGLERDGYSFVKKKKKGKNRFDEEVTYKRYYLANMRGN